MLQSGPTPDKTTSYKSVSELTLLFQFSNTLLSTIRLNKLTHLILAVLVSGENPLFGSATLFLRNEKSNVLQGMLGVTRNDAADLTLVGDSDPLISRWDISEEKIASQRTTDFCKQVRGTRIEIDENCRLIKRVILEGQVYHTDSCDGCGCCVCSSLRGLGLGRFATLPLQSRDKNIGMIVVDHSDSSNRTSLEDLRFLQLFAGQAGMAIENSMLYNRIEEANTNLRDARERLMHGEKLAAIGEVAAKLVHEVKNPLIAIGGFAGRLIKSLPAGTREYRYADTIFKESGRLERMLLDILTFSSKSAAIFQNCEIEEILREAIDNCSTTFEDHAICMMASFSDSPSLVLGDSFQIKQVFINLILNACEAMPNGGKLDVLVQKESLYRDCVTVTFSDSGGGIQPETLAKIFTPFFTTKRHGTGLGLAIVNRIIMNHHGTIEASNSSEGAVFKVSLPLAPHSETACGDVAQPGERCVRNA